MEDARANGSDGARDARTVRAKIGRFARTKIPEQSHAYRTEFQRDRARIIHSRAFRRLEYKTQVFLNGTGDHLRTRLTHSIEVASISRTIARALSLNEDLAEAIALAHDLGHSPFGHSGEEMLAECMREHGGFEHNRQSLRVVELLENAYPKFPGLNLTFEVREGLQKHQAFYDRRSRTRKNIVVPPSRRRSQISRMRSPTTAMISMTRSILKFSTRRNWRRVRFGKAATRRFCSVIPMRGSRSCTS